MPKTRDVGPGVQTWGDPQHKWSLDVYDLAQLREAFGDDLLVAFVRAFAMAERLAALNHVMISVHSTLDRTSFRYTRDVPALLVVTWATTREAVEIVESLVTAGVESCIVDRTNLEKLLAFRTRWKGAGMRSDVRNKIGFHFDEKVVRRGLDAWTTAPPKGERLSLVAGDGPREGNAAFPIALQVMLAGLGITRTQVDSFAEETMDDHLDFARNAQKLFLEVLKNKNNALEAKRSAP